MAMSSSLFVSFWYSVRVKSLASFLEPFIFFTRAVYTSSHYQSRFVKKIVYRYYLEKRYYAIESDTDSLFNINTVK